MDFALHSGQDLPDAALRAIIARGPVWWSAEANGWIVSSHDAVRTVLSDVSRFTSRGTPVAEVFGGEGMLVNDTPLHHRIRAVWTRQVGIAAMAARHAEFLGYAQETLAAVLPELEAGATIDLVPVFRAFVVRVIAGNFAVPPNRTDVFVRWSEQSADTPALAMDEQSEEHQAHFAVRQAVFDLIAELVADRHERMARGEQPDDLVSLMVAAEGRDGITPSVVADNVFNFMLGALDTSEKWFGNIVCRLYREPALLAQIAGERERIGRLIDEVMRFDTVAQVIQRRVRGQGVALCGQPMAEGDAVLVMLGAANRDAAVFAEPDRFWPDRPVRGNLGFGFGFHHCLGINIARQEALALIEAMIERLPSLRIMAVDHGETWALWGPRALHVALPTGGETTR